MESSSLPACSRGHYIADRCIRGLAMVVGILAFAFPVFKIERLDNVKSTLSESSFNEIFRFAITTSKFTIIGIA